MTWILLGLLIVLVALGIFLVLKQRQIVDTLNRPDDTETPMLLLQQQVEALREQVRANLEGSANLIQKQLGDLGQNINDRLKDSSQVMQQSQESVGARLDNASKVVADLQGKLGKLEEANARVFEVGKDIRSLQEILRSPKLRGSLGEFFLADLLAQILPPEHYQLQRCYKNNEKVDAAVLLGDRWVPVDAKFPLENFQKLLQVESEDEKKPLRKLFVSDVKKHIDAICQKYIKPDEGTFDFALMYVPAENVYYETIVKDQLGEGEHLLSHYAMKKKVIPVSPNTLYVYLHTIALGLRGMKIEKVAQEILAGLSRLDADLARIQDAFRKVGVHLHNAETSMQDADSRLSKFGDKMGRLHGGAETAVPAISEDEQLRLLTTKG